MKGNWGSAFIAAVLLGLAGYSALFIAPDEKTMHEIQRIFYFHVPSAWTAFVAFFIAFIAQIAYLAKHNMKWDWLAASACEVGLAFCSVVLVTGPIWAKPVWGIWWTWDARLTSTLVLWLLYVSYLILRTLVSDPNRRATLSAVFGVFAYLDVPLVYFSIRLWRTQHPQPVILGGPGSGLNPTMTQVLLLCWLALLTLMVILLRQRYLLEEARHEVEALRWAAESQGAEKELSARTGRGRPR